MKTLAGCVFLPFIWSFYEKVISSTQHKISKHKISMHLPSTTFCSHPCVFFIFEHEHQIFGSIRFKAYVWTKESINTFFFRLSLHLSLKAFSTLSAKPEPNWLILPISQSELMGLQLLNEHTLNPLNYDWNLYSNFQIYSPLALNPNSNFYIRCGCLLIYHMVFIFFLTPLLDSNSILQVF